MAEAVSGGQRAEPLRPGHRFPAHGITRLINATAVLRLIADERVGIDEHCPQPHITLRPGSAR